MEIVTKQLNGFDVPMLKRPGVFGLVDEITWDISEEVRKGNKFERVIDRPVALILCLECGIDPEKIPKGCLDVKLITDGTEVTFEKVA